MTPEEALSLAVEKSGGPADVARQLGGITVQAVCQWKTAPHRRVLEIERISGVSRKLLRPDLYPADAGGADAPAVASA